MLYLANPSFIKPEIDPVTTRIKVTYISPVPEMNDELLEFESTNLPGNFETYPVIMHEDVV